MARVAAYSRAPLAELGASAYFATDFYEGAAHLIDRLLGNPTATYGEIFAGEAGFDPAAVTRLPHPAAATGEVWLHRSAYFDGQVDYWYAFAGDPAVSPAAGMLGETAAAAVQSVEVSAPAPAAAAVPGRGTGFDLAPLPATVLVRRPVSGPAVLPPSAATPY